MLEAYRRSSQKKLTYTLCRAVARKAQGGEETDGATATMIRATQPSHLSTPRLTRRAQGGEEADKAEQECIERTCRVGITSED